MSIDLSNSRSAAHARPFATVASLAIALLVGGGLAGCGSDNSGGDAGGSDCTTNFDCPNPFDQLCVDGVCVDETEDVGVDVPGDVPPDVPGDADADDVEVEDTTDTEVTDATDVTDEGEDVDPDGSGDADVVSDVPESVCGDGDITGAEECDDGNEDDDDGCSSDCVLEWYCGDGTVDSDEECDDGNNSAGDGCSMDCTEEPVCGDGELELGEECDDGNEVDGDGCSSDCESEEDLPPSPVNNPWIAFISRIGGLEQISVVRASGGEQVHINTGDVLQYDPVWSPDGRRIAFRTLGSPNALLKIVDITTGEVTTFDPGLWRFAFPAFSPSGTRIVFEGRADAESSADIYIFNLADSTLTQVTDTSTSEANPVWVSRDVLYYVSNASGSFDAYRHDLTDDTVTRATFAPQGVLGGVKVSWDERYLLYRSRTGPESGELVLMDTTTAETFVVGSDRASDPAMSPDGAWFAFVERFSGQADIVLMDIVTRTLVGSRVTNDATVEGTLTISAVESDTITIDLGD